MKPKNFILITILGAIGCLGIWWFARQKEDARGESTEVPMASMPKAPNQLAPTSPQPSPTPSVAGKPIATPTPDTKADPQVDLKTAIPDIARLLRAGDKAGILQTYTEPGRVNSAQMQRLQALQQQAQGDPTLQRLNEAAAESYEALEALTPTYNDAGDEATYAFVMFGGGINPDTNAEVTFVKINGKWYAWQPHLRP